MTTPVRISLPFVGGIASGAFLILRCGVPQWNLCLFSSTSLFIYFALCLILRKDFSLFPLLFLLGLFCFCSASLCAEYAPPPQKKPTSVMRELQERISRQGWSDQTGKLLQALLTGDKSALSRETKEAFRKSGAAHILALSGLHLGVLSGILSTALRILGNTRGARIARVAILSTACTLYTIACNCSASLVRALLFIILSGIHSLFPGRKKSAGTTFCAAQIIQLTLDPLSILSLSFQLSYLSIAGILFIYPLMESWMDEISGAVKGERTSLFYRGMRKVWKSLALSLCCQITTAPLVYVKFGNLPPYFFLANLLALPLAEALIVLGVISLLLSAAGICPELFLSGCDCLTRLIEGTLQTISLMQNCGG